MPTPTPERRDRRVTAAEFRKLIHEAEELAQLGLIYAQYLRLQKFRIDQGKPTGPQISWERFKKAMNRFRYFYHGR